MPEFKDRSARERAFDRIARFIYVASWERSPAGQQPQRFLDFFEMVRAQHAIAIHQPPGRDIADLVDQQIGIVFEFGGFLYSDP